MNKQIEEIVSVLCEGHHKMDVDWTNHFIDGAKFPKPKGEHQILAETLYNAGYRKQSKGEWVDQYKGKYANALYKCSACGGAAHIDWTGKQVLAPFCHHCGAKMKGE